MLARPAGNAQEHTLLTNSIDWKMQRHISLMIINVAVFLISLLWLTPSMSSDSGRHTVKMECSGKGDFVRDEPVPPEHLEEWNKHMAEGHEINRSKSLVLHPLSGVMYAEMSGKAVRIRLPQDLIDLLDDKAGVWFTIYRDSFRSKKIVGVLKIPGLYSPDISIDRRNGEFLVISSNLQYSGHCTAAK